MSLFQVSSVVMLNNVTLIVIILGVSMLSVIILNATTLNVIIPSVKCGYAE
jgi:hypothetical protein